MAKTRVFRQRNRTNLEFRYANTQKRSKQIRGEVRHGKVRPRGTKPSVDDSEMWRERNEEDTERYLSHGEMDDSLESKFAPNY